MFSIRPGRFRLRSAAWSYGVYREQLDGETLTLLNLTM